MKEIWRDIKDYEGLYQVSNLGRVRSLDRYVKHSRGGVMVRRKGCLLKPTTNKGYKMVALSKNNTIRYYLIHRLVAEAFIPNPENKPYIDHINTIKTDNRVQNLRWVTRLENENNPLTRKHRSQSLKGENNPSSKPVLQYDKEGNFIKEWEYIKLAAISTNINESCISRCCKFKLKTAGGYIWRYVNQTHPK